jgi:uncharacterized protein
MTAMTQAPEVTDNVGNSRFEIRIDGVLAELRYRLRPGRLVLVHTGVPEELGGRGIGSMLVRAAVNKAVSEDLTIVPVCPFARDWLKRHPDIAATAPVDWSEPGAQ